MTWLALAVLAQAGVPAGAVPQEAAHDTLAPPSGTGTFSSASPEGAFSWGVLVRAFYAHAPEEAAAPGEGDVSGFALEDVDLFASWDGADVFARASVDAGQGEGADDTELVLEDAFARWQSLEWLHVAGGQFKPRIVRSASVPASELLFRERTFLGAAFDEWDRGVELGGRFDEFGYWLSVMDGANGSDADHFLGLRGVWAIVDDSLVDREGARDAPNHLRVVLGASMFRDDGVSTDEGDGFAGDLALTFGPYAFHGEWAVLDEEFAREIDVFGGHLLTVGDGHPFSATLSRLVGSEAELAVRFQDADEADSTEAFGVALSWTPRGGPGRLMADVQRVEGDTRDFSILSLGLSVGTSGIALR